jgi:iron complex outermembrane receptor protein
MPACVCCPRNGQQVSFVSDEWVLPSIWTVDPVLLVSPDTGQNRRRAHKRMTVDSGLRGRRLENLSKMITMNHPLLLVRSPALSGRILACAIAAICVPVAAQNSAPTAVQTIDPVIITGARFASDPALTPIGATVISADEIRRSGAGDVNTAIRKIGGVYGRQSLDGSPNFDLDLRGFGANSNQNVVVVLDGVRLSENELSSVLLSSIPIDNVERIEIMRGGSSVLYGEGATGGVINIITKRPVKGALRGSLFAEAGQFGLREMRASVAQAWDGFALDAQIGNLRTDNYRANNKYEQKTFSGGAQWTLTDGRIGFRVDSVRQNSRLPGALSLDEFNADPRQTNSPGDFGSLDSDRITGFVSRKFGDFELAAELSHRERKATYTSDFFASVSNGKQTQFSPRVRHLAKVDGALNEIVVGIDLTRWSRMTESSFSREDATQDSKAIYVRDEIKFNGPRNVRVAIGARHETFDKAAESYSIAQSQNAWELQGSFDVAPLVNLHAKAGQSYRVANVDENGFTATGMPLRGQTSHDLELGLTVGGDARFVTARVFRHKLNNEIFFDPTVPGEFFNGANTNLDPTRRQGIELEARARIGTDWRLSANVQHLQASFTDGPNAGREMVLVPKNIISARLSWVPGDGQSADFGAQWVDKQRYGSDFDNSCTALMSAFTTFDARYAKKIGAWELAVSGLNLADKHYFSQAFGCESGIYPASGRQLKVSARYDF